MGRHSHQDPGLKKTIKFHISSKDIPKFLRFDWAGNDSLISAIMMEESQEFDAKKRVKRPFGVKQHLEERGDSNHLKERLLKSTGRPIYNIQRENDLGGEKRFLVDGLADKAECQEMVQFAQVRLLRIIQISYMSVAWKERKNSILFARLVE